jgi:hypothetical protein
MVLVKSSSFTDVSFYITTEKPISGQLQQALAQKLFVTIGNTDRKAQVFLITNTVIQVKFSGIFQVIGQFMRCRLE